uniref:AAA family ATPase n=1 Tax=uncultured Succinatimonas sp. TaxID=1262973 RepID=UPI0025E395F0
MIDITKLPLSVTSFSDFVAKSKIYVDKTDLIANLARFDAPIFLSRPRRFGKSTLVSTFQELFSNGLEKFKDLKIGTEGLWNDKTYKVIHLDLSLIKENTQKSFEEALLTQLKIACEATNENLKPVLYSAATYLQLFLKHNTDNQYVLLIDEYDAPLTAAMADKEEFEKRRSVLSEFFLTVKFYSSKFRFIFITGVTRYSNTSIFSAFNNIKDISFNPTYGAIVGYTQEELEHYFGDYIKNAAVALNEKEKTDKYTYEIILNELKNNYDGYSFDEECEHHVYNPWSILNFLS